MKNNALEPIFEEAFLTLNLDLFRRSINEDISGLYSCANEVLRTIETKAEEFEKLLRETKGNVNHPDREDAIEQHSEHQWLFAEVYPKIIINSLFVTAYSYFESTMDDLSDFIAGERPHTVQRKDLNGKGVERAAIYLKKVQSIDKFPDQTPEWHRLMEAREVRNSLAHGEGFFTKPEKITQIHRSGWVVIDNEHLTTTRKGCLELIDTIESFYSSLIDIIDPNGLERLICSAPLGN